MKPTMNAQTIDAAKKTIGTTLLVASAALELLGELGVLHVKLGAITTIAAMGGAWLLGFGMMNARGKSAVQLAQQVFTTADTQAIQPQAIETAARAASLHPPLPVDQPPPAPGSKP